MGYVGSVNTYGNCAYNRSSTFSLSYKGALTTYPPCAERWVKCNSLGTTDTKLKKTSALVLRTSRTKRVADTNSMERSGYWLCMLKAKSVDVTNDYELQGSVDFHSDKDITSSHSYSISGCELDDTCRSSGKSNQRPFIFTNNYGVTQSILGLTA